MQHIKYGIIGCGMMGQEHIRNIALVDGADVLAIFEPDATMRAAAAALVPDAIFVESIREVLAIDDVNALLIASPNHLHVWQMQEIARQRPLPILVEKPVLVSVDDIRALKVLGQNYPAPIWVAMEYRYMPAASVLLNQAGQATGGITMLSIVEHRFPFLGKVGDWNRFNANSGGTFVEKCCHFFDLMRHIMKANPKYVMALGGQAHNHIDERYDGRQPDIWDHGYVIVEFENGKRASLELSMFAEGSPFQETISAIGPSGKIEAKIPGPQRFWPKERGPEPIARVKIFPRDPSIPISSSEIPVDPGLLAAGDHNGSTYYQHQRFINLIRTGGTPEVSLHDGIWAAAMGLAAQQSALEARAIHMHEFGLDDLSR